MEPQPVDIVLRDGSTVLVRAVRPGDEQALLAFLRGLSDESRYFRFFSLGVDLARVAAEAASGLPGITTLVAERGVDGRIVAVQADGRRVDYGYDAGRLTRVDGPGGGRRYDHTDGQVTSVTDADGVVELVNTYDPAGRVLTQRSPFGRTVTFTYAADGSTVVADDDETARLSRVRAGGIRVEVLEEVRPASARLRMVPAGNRFAGGAVPRGLGVKE